MRWVPGNCHRMPWKEFTAAVALFHRNVSGALGRPLPPRGCAAPDPGKHYALFGSKRPGVTHGRRA